MSRNVGILLACPTYRRSAAGARGSEATDKPVCCNALLGSGHRAEELGCARGFTAIGPGPVGRRQSNRESFQPRKSVEDCLSCLVHVERARESQEQDVAGAIGPEVGVSRPSRQRGVKLATSSQRDALPRGSGMNEIRKIFARRFGEATSRAPEIVPSV